MELLAGYYYLHNIEPIPREDTIPKSRHHAHLRGTFVSVNNFGLENERKSESIIFHTHHPLSRRFPNRPPVMEIAIGEKEFTIQDLLGSVDSQLLQDSYYQRNFNIELKGNKFLAYARDIQIPDNFLYFWSHDGCQSSGSYRKLRIGITELRSSNNLQKHSATDFLAD